MQYILTKLTGKNFTY